MEKSYRAVKMSEIDLEAQLAAVQGLEKEMSKLNGLPQILPILKYGFTFDLPCNILTT
jgi:hypothetical protein